MIDYHKVILTATPLMTSPYFQIKDCKNAPKPTGLLGTLLGPRISYNIPLKNAKTNVDNKQAKDK